MYKCRECGCEYKDKPDFCDCGNDEFDFEEEIALKKTEQPQEKAPQKQTILKTKQEKPPKKTFDEQYPSLARFLNSIDIISGSIFVFCIIMSFYVIFFAWNPKEVEFVENTKTETTISKKIPSINSFWNNELPKIEQPLPVEKPVVKETPVVKQTTAVQQKTQQTKVPKKTKTQTTTKKTTTVKPQKTNTTTTQKKQTQQAQTKPAAQTTPVQTSTQPSAPQKTDAEIAAEKAAAAQKAAQIKQEYNKYKVSLRNTIGRKIDFTKVVGDGECTVTFKINSSGKLINRSFSKQSPNITLNDAVYAAMMSTPSYNPPPEGYKNEFLNLNIRFYNGNFEITLK